MNFSVVIPVLNEEKYVGVLLECLCNQTFKDFEVLIIDGKSEDKTLNVVSKYLNKLNLTVIHAPKRGVSYQRNLGAKKSKNEHIIFFDADVYIDKKFVEELSEYLKNKDVDVLTSWVKPLSQKIIDKIGFWAFNGVYLNGLKRINPGSLGAFIYVKKASFIKAGMFDEDIVLAEDFELVNRMFKKGFKYAFLKRPKYGFSVRRLDKMGRLTWAMQILRSGVYYYRNGKIKDKNLFDYDFGKF